MLSVIAIYHTNLRVHNMSDIAAIIFSICFALLNFGVFSSPLCVTMHWINCHIMDLTRTNLEFWTKEMDLLPEYTKAWAQKEMNKDHKLPNLVVWIDRGLDIIKDYEALNDTFGGIMFFMLCQSFLSQICGFMFLSNFYMFFDGSMDPWFFGPFYGMSIILTGIQIARNITLVTRGQAIIDEVAKTCDRVKTVQLELELADSPIGSLTNRENKLLDLLISKLDNYQGVRPFATNTLSYECSLDTLATVMTYYVVLVQFRFSE